MQQYQASPCDDFNMINFGQEFDFESFLPFQAEGFCHCLRLSICPSLRPSFRKLYLSAWKPIMNFSWYRIKHAPWNTLDWYWKWRSMTLTFKVTLAILTHDLRNSACQCDTSSPIWSRITTFAPNMHPMILPAGIENGSHWPRPLRSFGHHLD